MRLPSMMPTAYSMAWLRVMRLAKVLRAPRLPLTAPTRVSLKCRRTIANASRSNVVSTSTMNTTSPVQALRPRLTPALLPPRWWERSTSSTLPSRCSWRAMSIIPSVEPSSTTMTCICPHSFEIVCSSKPSTALRIDFASLWPTSKTLKVRPVFGAALGVGRVVMERTVAPMAYRGSSNRSVYQNSAIKLTRSRELSRSKAGMCVSSLPVSWPPLRRR